MNFDIGKSLLKSLLIMGDVIEARDTYTGGHVWRVSQYAKLLAKQIGLSQDETTQGSIGGYLHDLGKVGISDNILRKKSGLDGNEFDALKTHPTIGGKLIEAHPLAELALDADSRGAAHLGTGNSGLVLLPRSAGRSALAQRRREALAALREKNSSRC